MSDDRVYEKLQDHDERITVNERFRLRAEGALTVIGFALGGGFAITLLALFLGLI